MAYAQKKIITYDVTKVTGGDKSNFVVILKDTFDGTGGLPDFRTTANGGDIENTDSAGAISGAMTVPADLAFYDDVDGTTQLDHEFLDYDPATGYLVVAIELPFLYGPTGTNTDTEFVAHYSDSGVTTSQENISGVWPSSQYALVAGMGDTYDSSANNGDFTFDSADHTETGAKIAKVADFEASNSDQMAISDSGTSPMDYAGAHTMSLWFKMESTTGSYGNIYFKASSPWAGASSKTIDLGYVGGSFYHVLSDGTNAPYTQYTFTPTNGTWYHLAVTWDGTSNSDSMKMYFNGSLVDSTLAGTGISSLNTNDSSATWGGSGSYKFDGMMERFKFQKSARDGGWIATEYTNQNSPTTCYSYSDPSSGTDTSGERQIEATGNQDSSGESNIESTGNSTTSSERAIVATGIHSMDIDLVAFNFTPGATATSSESNVESNGQDTASSNRDIESYAKDTTTANTLIETTGNDSASSESLIEGSGKETASSNRQIEALANASDSSERDVQVIATSPTGAEIGVDVPVKDTTSSTRDMESTGKSISFSESNIISTGATAASSESNIQSSGTNTASGDRSIEATGGYDISSERNIEVNTNVSSSGNISFEVTGVASDGFGGKGVVLSTKRSGTVLETKQKGLFL